MSNSVLLPYQKEWIADKSQVKVCEKSRRVGLSWGEAANSVLEAAKQSGQDTWYLGYSQDMAQEFIRDCAWWAGHFQVVAAAAEQIMIEDEDNDILAYRINFASGILALAAKQNASNVAIHASISSVRDGLVQIAQSMTANGQDVDGQILAAAQAIEIHDFDVAPEAPAQGAQAS